MAGQAEFNRGLSSVEVKARQPALVLVIVVVLDQQVAHELPGFAVGQATVFGNDDFDVETLSIFALESRQSLFYLGQAESAEIAVAGLAIADHDARIILDVIHLCDVLAFGTARRLDQFLVLRFNRFVFALEGQ